MAHSNIQSSRAVPLATAAICALAVYFVVSTTAAAERDPPETITGCRYTPLTLGDGNWPHEAQKAQESWRRICASCASLRPFSSGKSVNGVGCHWLVVSQCEWQLDVECQSRGAETLALADKQPVAPGETAAAAWPQFRGPDGQGHAGAPGLPVRFSDRKNVAWKTPIPGEGWSSPAIAGDQIWLTTALDNGKSLRAICIDEATGDIRHNIEVFRKSQPGRVHTKNGYASPTPVIDGNRVYVHFGANGTACLKTSGEIIWKTEISYYHHHGPGPSPILVGDKLILVCDGFTAPFYDQVRRSPDAPQFVAALGYDKGEFVWKKSRAGRHSYATPLAIGLGGVTQIVSPGGDRVTAYDPLTGDELWWCRYDGYSLVPRPVFGHGLVYVCTGYETPLLLAIRPDGAGDVTDSHVAWKLTQGVPKTSSPILVDDGLYYVSDDGVAGCVDAKSGGVRWKHRLGGNFSASPILADGRLLFLSESGQMHVLEPGPKFKKLATNVLEGKTLASPAVSGHALFLRTDRFLYRIEEIAAD